jgi:sensor c-di-GMP phosphodiesterase-like protein
MITTATSSTGCFEPRLHRDVPARLSENRQAFVKTIGSGAASAGIAQVIVDMAHALGLEIIAEGVETPDQVNFLRERGVHLAQGWYFSRPLPGPEFVAYVQKHA